jgi:hypothetical protein
MAKRLRVLGGLVLAGASAGGGIIASCSSPKHDLEGQSVEPISPTTPDSGDSGDSASSTPGPLITLSPQTNYTVTNTNYSGLHETSIAVVMHDAGGGALVPNWVIG